MADDKGITTREEDFSKWYIDVVRRAELADYSPVKGCMVIRPNGYQVWEKMQRALDDMFKKTGHKNAYFPLLIPKSFLSKEAQHVDGFAKECAVVTHYRLKNDPDGTGVVVDPDAKLEEELIIRPTSETMIWSMYKQWIHSYRDLPLLLNQWANVVRWEMRTRLFLRTTEFLWQEGHTAHATADEAEAETRQMLDIYQKFAEEFMAMPVVPGRKTEQEKFAGAEHTYTIEALMPDGKALQSGTSHNLGQNFAKAFDVTFLNDKGGRDHVYATSWGVSTRLLGALIMTHSDDRGFMVPPKLAAQHVVVVPVYRKGKEREAVLEKIKELSATWEGFAFEIDDRDNVKPGSKFYEWELKGIPLRIELGPRDIKGEKVVIARRDKVRGEDGHKSFVPFDEINTFVPAMLETIQSDMLAKAKARLAANTHRVSDYEALKKGLIESPGFYIAHWAFDADAEKRLAEETQASIRCIPFDEPEEDGVCIMTGKATNKKVVIAKAY